ncbi:TRAP transporter large permease [Pusillimonas noertemannii]|uniref:TRAP transporter large permease protein n=1 Tax=Pusillimonas noertemannii TaxID=305977 RepID=A0A2U1CQW0_9BURK|nr:TRAP transporter large permease subunit [Pusillimonas noertemannii]NYT67606.1 TRAP transporter large permease subunit [Pusillimonas noertemannii]PVY68278.1 tripartite ATP-independent transporter DctM subunit [Pusillimonas noertemannii]TFL12228.1 TRAP transporter large permease subunit [Pusillimonas noertemannii]
MLWSTALALLIGMLFFFLLLGLPVAVVFFGVNIIGAAIFLNGEIGLIQMTRNVVTSITNYSLVPIPLFILMGEVLLHSGMAFKAIGAIERLITRLPGRMAVVSVAAGTVFSALSGSTIANTAMLGRSLMPEMLRRGYHPTLSMGPIMATGSIAMLIPPSALAVLVGSLAGMSISRLLIAGIIPAILIAALFFLYIVIRATYRPQDAPAGDLPARQSLLERWKPFFVYVLPLSTILIAVVGSLLAGIATPTEAAALGVIASFLIAAAYRCLTWQALKAILTETAQTSTMILFIIMASTTFSQILAFSGATNGMVSLITAVGADPFAVLVMMMLILLILGCFVDQVSMVMITVPLFVPVANAIGIDLIWLGVVYLLTMEIGFLTPPFGLLLFVMKGIAPPEIRMSTVYKAALPFVLIEFLVLVLVLFFPGIGLWLPSLVQ